MTKGHKLVLAIFSRLRRRISFTALLLAFLSIAVIVVTPLSLGRNLPAAGSSVGLQKTSSSSQLTAAIASLQSGLGPLGIGPISCSATGLGSAQCETARSGQAVSTPSGPAISASGVTGSWTNITSSTGPSQRSGASMAYDTADGYVILFGGAALSSTGAATAVYGDTWRFLGGFWTNITSSSGPSPRGEQSMAYDTADGYVILFGGAAAGSSIFSDTWKFLGGSWTNITSTSGPSPRFIASMAYDAADGYVILFGGATYVASGNHFFGDTWKFSSTGTPPPFDYSLSNNGPVIITQGTSVTLTVAAKLTAGSALPVTLSCVGSSLPSGITCGSFTVNPVTSTTAGATSGLTVSVASSVSAGSYSFTVTGTPAGATASAATTTVTVNVSSPGPWTNITPSTSPSPQFAASMAYDAADGYVILFSVFGDTWKFNSGSWTNITSSTGPSQRVGASMAYDAAADGYVILFGGYGGSGSLGDTWKFLGGSWTNITSSTGPSPRSEASMVYDAADGYVVLFGGATISNGIIAAVFGDTWKFNSGSWTNITSSTGPSPRSYASMAYDSTDRYVILFGGKNSSVFLGDTWKFLGGSWTDITSNNGPSPRGAASVAFVTLDGYVVLFGGYGGSVFLGDTWKFLGGSWTDITSNTGPSPRILASMADDSTDRYVILF